MSKFPLIGAGVLILALAVFTGCSRHHGGAPKGGDKSAAKGDDDHDHGPGPHGGTIIEFGKWHGEFCMDHGKKQATVYILGGDAKKSVAIKVDKLLLSIKEPMFQIELKADPQKGDPEGAASRFVGVHDNFAKEQEFAGTLSGVVDGKPYAGDFKEEEHKDHKEKK